MSKVFSLSLSLNSGEYSLSLSLCVCVCSVRGGERCELAQLCSLLAVQLGVEHPDLLAAVKLPLLQLGQDPTATTTERAAVSVCVCARVYYIDSCVCFTESVSSWAVCLHPGIRPPGKTPLSLPLTGSHLSQETEGAMRELEAVFRCQLSPVVAAAVQSWSLLLSITPASRVPPLHTRYLSLPLVHTHSHTDTHTVSCRC